MNSLKETSVTFWKSINFVQDLRKIIFAKNLIDRLRNRGLKKKERMLDNTIDNIFLKTSIVVNNFLHLSTNYYYFTQKVLFHCFLFDSGRKFLLLSVAFSLIFLQ